MTLASDIAETTRGAAGLLARSVRHPFRLHQEVDRPGIVMDAVALLFVSIVSSLFVSRWALPRIDPATLQSIGAAAFTRDLMTAHFPLLLQLLHVTVGLAMLASLLPGVWYLAVQRDCPRGFGEVAIGLFAIGAVLSTVYSLLSDLGLAICVAIPRQPGPADMPLATFVIVSYSLALVMLMIFMVVATLVSTARLVRPVPWYHTAVFFVITAVCYTALGELLARLTGWA